MSRIYDIALEACEESGELRIIEGALRAVDMLDLTSLDGGDRAALEYVLLDAIADRLHAIADRLDARNTAVIDLMAGAEI